MNSYPAAAHQRSAVAQPVAARRSWQSPGVIAALFLLPNLLGFALFHLGPVLASAGLSLFQWDLLGTARFVGLGNYGFYLFGTDVNSYLFRKCALNTLYYAILVIPGVISVSLGLALLANQRVAGVKLFRTIYFIPVVSSMVAVAMAFRWLYSYDWGIINYLLSSVGLPRVHWLGDPRIALPSVSLLTVWKWAGYNMVIFLAGLQGIPAPLYEAAKIDGAGAWRSFRHITLPLLTPTIFFVLIMSTISSFQAFDVIYIMTQGGPANSTMVYNYLVYLTAFRFLRFGDASALAYMLLAVIFGLSLAQWRTMGRRVQYELV